MAAKPPLVSFLVVNFNRLELLEDCLASLRAQTLRSFEIVVVDNGSTDLSREFLLAQPPGLKLCLLEGNLGFTGGNIAGLPLCQGEYLALVNNDAMLDPGWAEAQLRALQAQPQAGFGASRILLRSNPRLLDSAGGGMTTSGRGFNLGEGQAPALLDRPRWVLWATAAAVMVRRRMLDQVGFFDPLFFFGCEDLDLGLRAQLAGWKCLYVPDAVAYHQGNRSHALLKGRADFYFSRNLELAWLKAMPASLLASTLHLHILHELAATAKRLRRPRAAAAFLLGKLAVLPLLPTILRQRWRIQDTRTLPVPQLRAMLTPALGRALARRAEQPAALCAGLATPLSAALRESLAATGLRTRLMALGGAPQGHPSDPCAAQAAELGLQGLDAFLVCDGQQRAYKLSGKACPPSLPPEAGPFSLLAVPKGALPFACLLSHSGELGGAERCLLEQVELLSAHGVLCHVVLPAAGPLSLALMRLPVSLSLSPMPWWAWDPKDGDPVGLEASIAASAEALAPALRQMGPDLLITRTCVIPQGGLLCRALGIPHLWQVDEFGEQDHGLRFQLQERERYSFIREHSHKVAFASAAMRDHALAQDPGLASKSLILRYGIRQPQSAGPVAQPLFQRAGSLKLALLGVIQPRKGQEDAVLAVTQVLRQGLDVELLLAGTIQDQAYGRHLAELAAAPELRGSIRILKPQKDAWPLLAEADVALMCSRSEAFGRITVEAMLSGKPVIGLRAGATPELVVQGESGYLYEAGDVQGLADIISGLAQNRESLAALGDQGRLLAQARFSPDSSRRALLPLLRSLMACPQPGPSSIRAVENPRPSA